MNANDFLEVRSVLSDHDWWWWRRAAGVREDVGVFTEPAGWGWVRWRICPELGGVEAARDNAGAVRLESVAVYRPGTTGWRYRRADVAVNPPLVRVSGVGQPVSVYGTASGVLGGLMLLGVAGLVASGLLLLLLTAVGAAGGVGLLELFRRAGRADVRVLRLEDPEISRAVHAVIRVRRVAAQLSDAPAVRILLEEKAQTLLWLVADPGCPVEQLAAVRAESGVLVEAAESAVLAGRQMYAVSFGRALPVVHEPVVSDGDDVLQAIVALAGARLELAALTGRQLGGSAVGEVVAGGGPMIPRKQECWELSGVFGLSSSPDRLSPEGGVGL